MRRVKRLFSASEPKPRNNKAEIEREKKRKQNFEIIMAATGWDEDTCIRNFRKARKMTGCRLDEYVQYRFYDMDEETQKSWCLVSVTKGMTKTFNTDPDFVNLLRNKARTNEYLSDYLGRAWCVNTEITREDFRDRFINSERVFYKPISSSWGRGSKPFDVNEETIDSVYDELVTMPKGVVEEYVRQHDEMNRLSPTAVNTVRMVTVSSKTKPVKADGTMADIVYCMVKMGGETGCVDNLHGGGLGAHVDLETGVIVTPGVNENAVPHNYHPVTGTKIEGFQIPYCEEIKDLTMRTITDLGLEGYLGWDIAVTNDGPVIIEINTHPGVTLLQLPFTPQKIGMKHLYDKYLIEN